MAHRKAWLAGATGLIGGQVLELLLAEPAYTRVTALVRRPLAVEHDVTPEGGQRNQLEALIVDFDRLEELSEPPPADDVFCCLGSTMKKAGSKAAFRKVDHDYVVATARLGLAAGARRFLLVSAVGASASSMSFYSRVKGEAEDSVAELGYSELHVFQPSILIGERDEARPGERLGIAAARVLNGLMAGPLRRYRGIRAETVAAAMVAAAHRSGEGSGARTGRQTYTHDAIARLGRGR